MFGMSMTEILFIVGIALIVLGPEKLPKVAQMLGRGLRELRQATSGIREAIEIEDIRKQIEESNQPTTKPRDPYTSSSPYANVSDDEESYVNEDAEDHLYANTDDSNDDDLYTYGEEPDDESLDDPDDDQDHIPYVDDEAALAEEEERLAYERSSISVDHAEDEDEDEAEDKDNDPLPDPSSVPVGAVAAAGIFAAGGSLAVAAQNPSNTPSHPSINALPISTWSPITGLGVLIERVPIPTPPLELLGGVQTSPVQGGPHTS